jgi:hypothetical protein
MGIFVGRLMTVEAKLEALGVWVFASPNRCDDGTFPNGIGYSNHLLQYCDDETKEMWLLLPQDMT